MLSKYQNENCIAVYNLRKQYSKDNTYAVDGITFDVKYGTVFGFLGPNGAGKTTTLKILTTLLTPSSGSICIFGKDLVKNQSEIKKLMGVVSQNPSFEANLTVERALDLYGMLWGLRDKKMRKHKVNEILNVFDLESIRNVKNDDLSIGQRRRVQVAREFMHEMDLLFLDEPTVGLDPSARRLLLDYIKLHVKSGLTVFFTTHIMEEAEYLCDEIAIIHKGKIIAFDTPTGLKQKYGRGAKTIELTFKDMLDDSFINLLNTTISKKNIKDDGSNIQNSPVDVKGTHTIRARVNNTEEIISEILQLVYKNGLQIESIDINPPSLEEVFLSVVSTGMN
ncbi:MAG TPA: ABC transporter ATP-binding protein [Nitrososphaeraceae archaeon]|jgi:ABC-2 type transport system ATP-binding protein|nr:ABC transporter ATP-binding protein [Nitrososphaeraceae archaeon]